MIDIPRFNLPPLQTNRRKSRGQWVILILLGITFTWTVYPLVATSGQPRNGLSETALSQAGLDDYALYQRAQGLLDSGRKDEAERVFRQVANRYPASLLSRPASLQAAGNAFGRGNYQQTLNDLTSLLEKNDGTALKLAIDSLTQLNRRNEALRRIRQLHFEAPQSAEAERTGELLRTIGVNNIGGDSRLWRLRADKLYQAGLWLLSARSYRELEQQFSDQSTDEVRLLAGISFYKGNSFEEATAVLQQIRSRHSATTSEAQYYLGMSQLSLENEAAALEALNTLRRTPSGSKHESSLLYALGQYHLKRDRPEKAAPWFNELVTRHPESEKADEAHFWLAWRAHSNQNHALAARLLTDHLSRYSDRTEHRGRAAFWAAINHERSGNRARAMSIYRGLLMRYGASWYGINAEKRIAKLATQGTEGQAISADPTLRQAILGLQTIRRPNETLRVSDREHLVKAEKLIRLGLHQSAMNELEAARLAAPDSPLLNLRIAQILRDNGDAVGAINALKRSYPDYGQSLPDEMSREEWEIFYPLKWWSEIRQEARRHQIDPYLIAGIIRQETVFNPKARSRANAIGLMQLLPTTGIAVAKKNSLGTGRISAADLYNPVLNIKLGTAYVKEMLDRFDRFEYVAAAYNGGPTRVSRWLRELPAQEIEDWVESIPITETRLYVQGVYRNSIHYQRLYDENGKFRPSVK
jgi:soluble lytic murein transglycosylase